MEFTVYIIPIYGSYAGSHCYGRNRLIFFPQKTKNKQKKNLYEYISHPQLNDIKSDCVTSKSGENTDKFSFGFSFAP